MGSDDRTPSAQFRVGDIIENKARPNVPRRLMFERKTDGCWYTEDNAVLLPQEMKLLRRPVQVGDVLRSKEGHILSWVLKSTDHKGRTLYLDSPQHCIEELPTFDGARWGVQGIWLDVLEHADGTPIAPPPKEIEGVTGAPPRFVPVEGAPRNANMMVDTTGFATQARGAQQNEYTALQAAADQRGMERGGSACITNAMQNKPSPPPDAEYWRGRFNAADSQLEDAKRQISMLEADAKSVHGELEKAMRDRDLELIWLKNEIRRLDPRLWKARYGR